MDPLFYQLIFQGRKKLRGEPLRIILEESDVLLFLPLQELTHEQLTGR